MIRVSGNINPDERRTKSYPHCQFSKIVNNDTEEVYYRMNIKLKNKMFSNAVWEHSINSLGKFLLPVELKERSRQISMGKQNGQIFVYTIANKKFNCSKLTEIVKIANNQRSPIPQDICLIFLQFITQYMIAKMPHHYLQLKNLFIQRQNNLYGSIFIFSEQMFTVSKKQLYHSNNPIYSYKHIIQDFFRININPIQTLYQQKLVNLLKLILQNQINFDEILKKVKNYNQQRNTITNSYSQSITRFSQLSQKNTNQQINESLVRYNQNQIVNVYSQNTCKKKKWKLIIILLVILVVTSAIISFLLFFKEK